MSWSKWFVFIFSVSVLGAPLAARAVDKTRADEQAGAILFRDKGCAHCHGDTLEGTKKAPSIKDIDKDPAWTTAKMTDQILNGGQKMPPFSDSLTDDEIARIVRYLRAKNRPSPPPAEP
ncbi:MAG TPA: cytochrome c [Terracidiphilus sp.]|jgi:mono/diheme cytochrome c family protein